MGGGPWHKANFPAAHWLSLPFDTPEGAWRLSWQPPEIHWGLPKREGFQWTWSSVGSRSGPHICEPPREARGGKESDLAETMVPAPPLNPSGLAERPGIIRGIKRKRKPMGCGEIRLVPWAPTQKLIALRPSNYVCACCQNGL